MNDATKRAAIKKSRASVYQEYERATKDLLFTKDFNSRLDVFVHDPLATANERIMAYILRRASGEYALFAIKDDGTPLLQRDVEIDLVIDKRVVSKVVAYNQFRGYLEDHPKLLTPVIGPKLDARPLPPETSKEWAEFVENWKVAHSTDFERLTVARSTVKEIRKVMRSDYKKSKEQRQRADATLLKISESNPETGKLADLSPLERSNLKRPKPAQQPHDGEQQAKDHAAAVAYLFDQIEHMQQAYPKTPFSKPAIDRNDPGDQGLVNRILRELGTTEEQYLVGFIVHVAAKFKGIGKTGVRLESRAPGTEKGPVGLGLLVNWAKDYARIDKATPRSAGGGHE